MSNKIALLLFTTSVLLASTLAVNLHQASALVQRDFSVYDDSHTTARYGNSKVCGDHMCAVGEHSKWMMALSASQRLGYGKVGNASHGEIVLHKMVGTIPAQTTMHGSAMSESMKMSGSAGNATQGTK